MGPETTAAVTTVAHVVVQRRVLMRQIKTSEEQDVYSKWRKVLIWASRPGAVKKVKRRTHKRERREAKAELRSMEMDN